MFSRDKAASEKSQHVPPHFLAPAVQRDPVRHAGACPTTLTLHKRPAAIDDFLETAPDFPARLRTTCHWHLSCALGCRIMKGAAEALWHLRQQPPA
jgi:hypothetical protein